MVEALIARLGFDIVGIADTTAASVALIHAARPDVVIYDLALGYNTDFDVIGAAITVGAKTVVFSHSADEDVLSHYKPRPTIVPKPDLVGLEQVLARLEVDDDRHQVTEQERRRRPVRVAGGPPPMGVTDAQAFYEALSSVTGDDALVTLELLRRRHHGGPGPARLHPRHRSSGGVAVSGAGAAPWSGRSGPRIVHRTPAGGLPGAVGDGRAVDHRGPWRELYRGLRPPQGAGRGPDPLGHSRLGSARRRRSRESSSTGVAASAATWADTAAMSKGLGW